MFVLVRHGETDGNANRIVQVPETPLNERGLAQAGAVGARLGRELGGREIRLFTSDLARAAMTAAPVAEALGVRAEEQPLLQERNFGDLRGRGYAEIGVDIMAEGYAPPAGETWETFHARVDEAWAFLRRAMSPGVCVIAVSHGLVCRSLAENHFDLGPGLEPPERWGNTCVSVVQSEPPYAAELLNCTTHLDAAIADGGQISGI